MVGRSEDHMFCVTINVVFSQLNHPTLFAKHSTLSLSSSLQQYTAKPFDDS